MLIVADHVPPDQDLADQLIRLRLRVRRSKGSLEKVRARAILGNFPV